MLKNQFQIQQVRYQDIDECAQLLSVAFTENNELWAQLNKTQVYNLIKKSIKQLLDQENQMKKEGYLDPDTYLSIKFVNQKNQILTVHVCQDLYTYMNNKDNSNKTDQKFDFYKEINEQCSKLEKQGLQKYEQNPLTKGKQITPIWLGSRKQLWGTGIAFQIANDILNYYKSRGIWSLNSRTSTYKTIGFSKKFILSGFTISDAYPIKFPNGKVYNFWYLRYDFLKIQMPPPKFKNNVGKKRIRARL